MIIIDINLLILILGGNKMGPCKFNDCIFYENGKCTLQQMFSSYAPHHSCIYYRPKESHINESPETFIY